MSYAVQCNACKRHESLGTGELPQGWQKVGDNRHVCPECWARFLKWMEEGER